MQDPTCYLRLRRSFCTCAGLLRPRLGRLQGSRAAVPHFDLIAGLARKLDSVPEGDGTMLDNTLILYLSDAAERHHSEAYEWPMVLLGNIGGKLKTGRYIDYLAYGRQAHRTTANMYTTLLQLAGSSRERFGMADPRLRDFDQSGPLTELLA